MTDDAPVTAAGEWTEAAHPRGEHGKFRKLDEIMGDLHNATSSSSAQDRISVNKAQNAIREGKRAQARTVLSDLEKNGQNNQVKALAQEAQSRLKPLKVTKTHTAPPRSGASGEDVHHDVTHPDHGHIGVVSKVREAGAPIMSGRIRVASELDRTRWHANPNAEPGGKSGALGGSTRRFYTRAEAEHHLAEHADSKAIAQAVENQHNAEIDRAQEAGDVEAGAAAMRALVQHDQRTRVGNPENTGYTDSQAIQEAENQASVAQESGDTNAAEYWDRVSEHLRGQGSVTPADKGELPGSERVHVNDLIGYGKGGMAAPGVGSRIMHRDNRKMGTVSGPPHPAANGGHEVPVQWDNGAEPPDPRTSVPKLTEDDKNEILSSIEDAIDAEIDDPSDDGETQAQYRKLWGDVHDGNPIEQSAVNEIYAGVNDAITYARDDGNDEEVAKYDAIAEKIKRGALGHRPTVDAINRPIEPDNRGIPDSSMGGGPGTPAWDRMMPSEVQTGDTIAHPASNRPIKVNNVVHGPNGVTVTHDDNGTERNVLLPHHTPVARITAPAVGEAPGGRDTRSDNQVLDDLDNRLTVKQHQQVINGTHDHGLTVREHSLLRRRAGQPAPAASAPEISRAQEVAGERRDVAASNAESIAGDNLPKGYGIQRVGINAGPNNPSGDPAYVPVHNADGAIGPAHPDREVAKQAIRDHATGRMRNGADALRQAAPDANEDPVEWDANATKAWKDIHPDFKSKNADGTRSVLARTRRGATISVPWRGPEGATPAADRPATIMNKPDPVNDQTVMRRHDLPTLQRMARDKNLRFQDRQAAQAEIARRAVTRPEDKHDRPLGHDAGFSPSSDDYNEAPGRIKPGDFIQTRTGNVFRVTGVDRMTDGKNRYDVESSRGLPNSFGSNEVIRVAPTPKDAPAGTAQRSTTNKPVGSIVHVRQPGGTQRLGTVTAVDGQHRHVELNPIGGGTQKQKIRVHASQITPVENGPAPSRPVASPGGRSAKAQRAFQAASEGDHKWLEDHGFDARPGDSIHVNDDTGHIALGKPDGTHSVHRVNGNGQAAGMGQRQPGMGPGDGFRTVHEPRTGATAMPTGSAPDGGVRGTQSDNPGAKAMTERILANRQAGAAPGVRPREGRKPNTQNTLDAIASGDTRRVKARGLDLQPGDTVSHAPEQRFDYLKVNHADGSTSHHMVDGTGRVTPVGIAPHIAEQRDWQPIGDQGSTPATNRLSTGDTFRPQPQPGDRRKPPTADEIGLTPSAPAAGLDKYGVPADKTNQQLGTQMPTLPADHRQIADDLKAKYMATGPEHDRGISDDLRRYYLLNNQGGRDDEAAFWLRSAEEQAARKDSGGTPIVNGVYKTEEPRVMHGGMTARQVYKGRDLEVRKGKEWGTLGTYVNGQLIGTPSGTRPEQVQRELDSLRKYVDAADEQPGNYGDYFRPLPKYAPKA